MRTANRTVGFVAGGVFVALGGVGLVLSLGTPFFGAGVSLAGIVSTNPAQAVIQIVLGAILVLGATRALGVTRATNAWSGLVFLVLGFVGLFLVGPEPNVLALTATGNAVHFAASAVLLAVGLGADRPAEE